MSFLRIWRKLSGKTQAEVAQLLGENHKTYSAYERGASPIPPETLSRLRGMGYDGPVNQRISLEQLPLTRDDFFEALAAFQKSLESVLETKRKESRLELEAIMRGSLSQSAGVRVPVILPEHVQEAWLILAEAMEKSGAQFKFIDRSAFGLLTGLTAEELARNGDSAQTRARLLAQAEKFLRPSTKAR